MAVVVITLVGLAAAVAPASTATVGAAWAATCPADRNVPVPDVEKAVTLGWIAPGTRTNMTRAAQSMAKLIADKTMPRLFINIG